MKKYQLNYTGKFSELMLALLKITVPIAFLLGIILYLGGRGTRYSREYNMVYSAWDTSYMGPATYSVVLLLVVIYNILVIWIFVKHFINSTALITEEV